MTSRSDRLRTWFPLPFVAIVVLLVVLILVTPNLVSTQAGGLCSEAQLLVDWSPGSPANLTHFYVRGICTVRYDSIMLGLGTNVSASGVFSPPPSSSSFDFSNVTWSNQSIIAAAATPVTPIALNVSAVYTDSSLSTVRFIGTYAFDVAGGRLYYQSYPASSGAIPSVPVSSLPLTLLLTETP
jgi:hypothetical protein